MNWRAQTLPFLINGLPTGKAAATGHNTDSSSDSYNLPRPSSQQIASISPYAQILRGAYTTPTFLIHGTADDLIPWEHSQRVVDALRDRGVESQIEVLEGVEHLFDTFSAKGWEEIERGYRWLAGMVL